MKLLHRLRPAAILAAFFVASPAVAQWQVPSNEIPVGRGGGTGFTSSYTPSGTGAAPRTVRSKLQEVVSIKDFGAVGDGVANDTTALSNAMATGRVVYAPKGTYRLTGTCPTMSVLSGIIGDGTYQSVFDTSGCTGHALTIATGLTGVVLQDFAMVRTGGATTGQDGIHFNNLTEQAYLNNLRVEGHWINYRLGITSYSFGYNMYSNNARSHGIAITNADGAGGMQWYLVEGLSQQSDGDGINVSTSTSAASVGTFTNMKTYANKGRGMAFVGTSLNPLQAIRLFGGFVGEDCSHELYFDTYGNSTITIEGMFIEIAGTSTCGVNRSTPATNVGNGIRLTANNTAVAITNNNIIGNSYSGISSNAARVQITGNNLRINGAAAVGGEIAGIAIAAGNATISGNSSKGQSFGVTLASDNNIVVGNDFSENSTAEVLGSVNLIASTVCNNYPASAAQSCVVSVNGIGNTSTSIGQYSSLTYTNAAFTAPRTWTLPAANSVRLGKSIQIVDLAGTITSSNTLTIARAGSDTVNGGTSVALSTAYSSITLVSDGVSKWSYPAVATNNAILSASPANPTGTSVTTPGVMMGLGVSSCRIAPVNSTQLQVTIDGAALNNVAGQTTNVALRYGTGAGPANAVAATGTQVGNIVTIGNGGSTYQSGFSLTRIITGLTPGTTYWLDLSVFVSANSSFVTGLTCTAREF